VVEAGGGEVAAVRGGREQAVVGPERLKSEGLQKLCVCVCVCVCAVYLYVCV
jgi:hypothetical protein